MLICSTVIPSISLSSSMNPSNTNNNLKKSTTTTSSISIIKLSSQVKKLIKEYSIEENNPQNQQFLVELFSTHPSYRSEYQKYPLDELIEKIHNILTTCLPTPLLPASSPLPLTPSSFSLKSTSISTTVSSIIAEDQQPPLKSSNSSQNLLPSSTSSTSLSVMNLNQSIRNNQRLIASKRTKPSEDQSQQQLLQQQQPLLTSSLSNPNLTAPVNSSDNSSSASAAAPMILSRHQSIENFKDNFPPAITPTAMNMKANSSETPSSSFQPKEKRRKPNETGDAKTPTASTAAGGGGGGLHFFNGLPPAASSSSSSRMNPKAINNNNFLVERPKTRFHDLAGIESILHQMKELILYPLLYPDLYAHLGVCPPCGILLYGPSGCGKTTLAHAIAGETGLNFFKVRNLFSFPLPRFHSLVLFLKRCLLLN